MQLRGLAPTTQRSYLHYREDYAIFFKLSPDQRDLEAVRQFGMHMLQERKLSPETIDGFVSSAQFRYLTTLEMPWGRENFPSMRVGSTLPVVLDPEEIARFFDYVPSLKYRAALMLCYGAGLRISEAVAVKVTDIDSKRMMIRVEEGKGRKNRAARRGESSVFPLGIFGKQFAVCVEDAAIRKPFERNFDALPGFLFLLPPRARNFFPRPDENIFARATVTQSLPSPSSPSTPYRIHCSEIWGGNQNADLDLCTRSITASLHSAACDAEKGGDISYLAVCSHDILTRIVIADVRGHGQIVSRLSQWIYEALRKNIDTHEGTTILRELNPIIFSEGFQGLTTAVVATFCTTDSSLSVCYAGHPPVLLNQRASGALWSELHVHPRPGPANLPLGVRADTAYDETVLTLKPKDRIALYTDGITERANCDGLEFGVDGLRAALPLDNVQALTDVKQNILAAVQRHTAEMPCDDDLTLLLIEAL